MEACGRSKAIRQPASISERSRHLKIARNKLRRIVNQRCIRSNREAMDDDELIASLGALLDAGALQPSRTARNHLLWLTQSQSLGARRSMRS